MLHSTSPWNMFECSHASDVFGGVARALNAMRSMRLLISAGQGHVAGTYHAMSVTTHMLVCEASHRIIIGEDDRLRALQHVCSALPRAAQALHEQVRANELCLG